MNYLTDVTFKKIIPPDETSFIMLEAVQGAGGYIVPPKEFFTKLREICDEHGILLIADEIQSGFGRTGKYFAIEHEGVSPDIMVMAKDSHGKTSEWSDPLAVSMPKNKAFFFNSILLEILERLMERFPLLEQILSSRPIISELLGL